MSYKNKTELSAVIFCTITLFWLILLFFGVIGWVLNIEKIFHSDFTHITGQLVLRIIGVFVFIIGCVLGWM